MMNKTTPKAKTISELLDAVRDGNRTVAVPPPTGKKQMHRSEPTNFDRLLRCLNKKYHKGLSEAVLREAIADVAGHKDFSQGSVRRMSFSEFTSVLEVVEVTGQPRYGPDPNKPILWWEGETLNLSRKNWQLLSLVWGRYDVSFAEIGEQIWNDDAVPSNTIRQVISRFNNQLQNHGIGITLSSDAEHVSPLENWPD